jgi:hypothetical protein
MAVKVNGVPEYIVWPVVGTVMDTVGALGDTIVIATAALVAFPPRLSDTAAVMAWLPLVIEVLVTQVKLYVVPLAVPLPSSVDPS